MYHLLRADEFDADRALELGFVQEVVPAGEQIDRARAIAAEICECAPLAVQEIKRAAFVYVQQGEQAAFDEIPRMRERTLGSEDAKEGIASFILFCLMDFLEGIRFSGALRTHVLNPMTAKP